MSLQICPNCKNKFSFCKIYKKINKRNFYKDHLIKCEKCNYKLWFKNKKKTIIEHILKWFMWMFLPIALIWIVIAWKMNAFIAIFLVIIYHIISMYFIIKRYNYSKIEK